MAEDPEFAPDQPGQLKRPRFGGVASILGTFVDEASAPPLAEGQAELAADADALATDADATERELSGSGSRAMASAAADPRRR